MVDWVCYRSSIKKFIFQQDPHKQTDTHCNKQREKSKECSYNHLQPLHDVVVRETGPVLEWNLNHLTVDVQQGGHRLLQLTKVALVEHQPRHLVESLINTKGGGGGERRREEANVRGNMARLLSPRRLSDFLYGVWKKSIGGTYNYR